MTREIMRSKDACAMQYWGTTLSQSLITWRISARAEISTRLTGLKFCCDYMTDFSQG